MRWRRYAERRNRVPPRFERPGEELSDSPRRGVRGRLGRLEWDREGSARGSFAVKLAAAELRLSICANARTANLKSGPLERSLSSVCMATMCLPALPVN